MRHLLAVAFENSSPQMPQVDCNASYIIYTVAIKMMGLLTL